MKRAAEDRLVEDFLASLKKAKPLEPEGLCSIDSTGASSSSGASDATVLRSGLVLIKKFLSIAEQKQLLATVHELGRTDEGFYRCHNEKTKRMEMMNLGRKTNGKMHKLRIPKDFCACALRANGQGHAVCKALPILKPDICVINRYSEMSKLSLHQDIFSSRSRKIPVVSLSIGLSAEFVYKHSWSKKEAQKSIILESGDCLLFGGQSRGIIHGVSRIIPESAPTALGEHGQHRYNLNFREY